MVDIARKIAGMQVKHMEPAWDMVLVEIHREGETANGVVLPEGYVPDGPPKGTVVKVGPGRPREDGALHAMISKPGDIVTMTFRGQAQTFKMDGREYMLMSEQQITMFYREKK